MKLSHRAIDNRVAVYLLMAIILIMGWSAYTSLPKEASPDISIPIVVVTVPYIGVSPTDIEGLVAQPLEQALKSLKDVKEIRSVSKEGLATIRVEFNTGIDIDEAIRRVRDKVSSTRNQLPNDILEPNIIEINLSEFPIMYVNVGGEAGLARLKVIAEDIQDKVESVPGVLRADISGGLNREVRVECDVYRLNAYQVSFEDVSNAIRNENLTIPGGSIDDKQTNFSVRIPGEFKEPRRLEDIILKIQNGKPIYLRDVAAVDYSFEDRASHARLNGREVVSLGVRKRAGENLIRIADEVKQIVEAQRAIVPAGISLEISNDQSEFIRTSVHELENSIITGMVLVVLSLFMFFGTKNSILIATAIPLSMFIGFIVLGAFDITLNFVVLFSLVLVLGILVDDAVVVIENIYRHQQEYHKTPVQAAKDAISEVAVPVFTSTLSTVSPFIPLLFWPGIVGEFMWYLPITLLITLGASLFVANIISPVQGAQWIDYRREIAKVRERVEHPHWYIKYNPFTWLYHKTDEALFPWMQKEYVKALSWSLANKGKTLFGATGFSVMVTILFVMFNKGVEFFPSTEPRQANVQIEMPPGTSLDITNDVAAVLEQRIDSVQGRKDIEFLAASAGTSDDMFDFGGQGTSNKGRLSLNFFRKTEREYNTFETLENVRGVATGIPGADLRLVRQEMGPPVGAAVSIEVSGDDYDELARLSGEMLEKIRTVDGLTDLKDDYNVGKPEIEVIVDREAAGLFWTSTGQIAGTVRAAVSGTEASKYRVGDDEYKIRVRLQEDQRLSATDLENLRVSFMNRRGTQLSIPLTSVASVRQTTGVSEIRRKDMKRVITITGDVQGRVASEVLNEVKARLTNQELPAGYELRFTGKDEEQQKASSFLMQAFVVTLMLVFLTLVIEFNSMMVPLVIMISVPLSFFGVFLGLIVTQTAFSIIMTGVAVIALAGIVVKNAIVLLDFVKQKRTAGMTLDEALIEAGRTRLRPVVLTAVTTVLGVLPLATGFDFDWRELEFVVGAESAGFWGPLGIGIISGLTVSSFLTLVIVPTVYSLLDEWQRRIQERINRWRKPLPENLA